MEVMYPATVCSNLRAEYINIHLSENAGRQDAGDYGNVT